MPLIPGKGHKPISQNIQELLHSFHQKGKIGNTTPGSDEQARKIAAAIAYKKAGE